MQQKLGLDSVDEYLFKELFDTMQMTASDFTNTFRVLANLQKSGENLKEIVDQLTELTGPKEMWLKKVTSRFAGNPQIE